MKGVTLIGMPGAGKSTIGKILAQRLNFQFVDLDALIVQKEGKSHTDILAKLGDNALVDLESRLTLGLNLENMVFAPGGSIIYSTPAMEKVRKETAVIYLNLPFSEIQKRLGANANTRGIVGLKEKRLEKLFAERSPLYRSFANHIVSCQNLTNQQITESILMFLRTLE